MYHSKALGSHHIAEKLVAAEVLAMPLPLTRTRAFPVSMVPNPGLGAWFNAFSYRLASLGNALWGGATNDFRVKTLGLAHEWLFPRMRAVVHHGGAGSTMAGLRAGKPTVICPFLGDQPFWGQVVLRAGLGPVPVPQKSLTAERLADAIRAAQAPAMATQAAAVGERIRAEDGAARAVDLIEQGARLHAATIA